MSIKFARYSGFPPEIFEKGFVPKMSASGFRLYIFLCRESDRKSSLQLYLTDRAIILETGTSARALTDARVNLKNLGLIECNKDKGGAYTYDLCDTETCKPFPGDPKAKQVYVKKVKSWTTEKQTVPPVDTHKSSAVVAIEPEAPVVSQWPERKMYFEVPKMSGEFISGVSYNTPNGYDR